MISAKYYIVAGMIALAVTGASCKKWLTVQPKTRMTGDAMYSSETGFKDALVGSYIQLKANSAYGKSLIYSTMESLVSTWDTEESSTGYRIGRFDYSDENVQKEFTAIFDQQYKVIGSVNAILERMDGAEELFTTDGLYELIRSECLAIRALCHFDLLRLFGPVPGDVPGGAVLPYVKTLSNAPHPHLAHEAFKTLLLEDLIEAEKLSENVDPILRFSLTELANPRSLPTSDFDPLSDFNAYRNIRMNYYAIKALQARAYLWFGDKDMAYANALAVIDARNTNNTRKFSLSGLTTYERGDMSLFSEQIFAVYDFNLNNKYDNDFGKGIFYKGENALEVNHRLYGNTGTDVRERFLWDTISVPGVLNPRCAIRKYRSTANVTYSNLSYYMLPVIRLSELYLIAIETAPAGEAANLWNTFRQARNLASAELPSDPALLQYEIIHEYRKEFVAEGQAFYQYKRVNAPTADIVWAPAGAVANYVVPLPLSETMHR